VRAAISLIAGRYQLSAIDDRVKNNIDDAPSPIITLRAG
jgi:hypothetical protein